MSRVRRWALCLCRFLYVIEHFSSTVFAGIMTRWTKGYRRNSCHLRSVAGMLHQESQQVNPYRGHLGGPTPVSLRAARTPARNRPRHLTKDSRDNLRKCNRRIWIPECEHELQLQLLVTAHSPVVWHRGVDAPKSISRESFWWSSLDRDATELVRGCLHCIVTRSVKPVPRPISTSLHG